MSGPSLDDYAEKTARLVPGYRDLCKLVSAAVLQSGDFAMSAVRKLRLGPLPKTEHRADLHVPDRPQGGP